MMNFILDECSPLPCMTVVDICVAFVNAQFILNGEFSFSNKQCDSEIWQLENALQFCF